MQETYRAFQATFIWNLLKILTLSHCSNLKNLPEISGNIEELYLDGTAIEGLPSSIQSLYKLQYLDLEDCKNLFRSRIGLNPAGCSNLNKFPEISWCIRRLYLYGSAIKDLPSSIGFLSGLRELNVENCTRLERLPTSICWLKCEVAQNWSVSQKSWRQWTVYNGFI